MTFKSSSKTETLVDIGLNNVCDITMTAIVDSNPAASTIKLVGIAVRNDPSDDVLPS